jgi:mono/diheme cytochrome c family protein
MFLVGRKSSMNKNHWLKCVFGSSLALLVPARAGAACPSDFPEGPAIARHLEEADITNGIVNFDQIRDAGGRLFQTRFNICDGFGRPATTGGGLKRAPTQPFMIRTSSPESVSCSGCHSQPFVGGAGDFVANVFVLAQRLDPITESVDAAFSDERNTLGMNGAGAIEMLSREMTADLQAMAQPLPDGTYVLTTKGVEFGITKSGGQVVASEGVNTDLVVRPFSQGGVTTSVRQFSIDAMNHHHGMQAEERFDLNPDRGFDSDFDQDGVHRELTIGDITSVAIWQESLSVPQQVLPGDPAAVQKIQEGQALFGDIGCSDCHKPTLVLNSRFFSEPNPYNPPGTWKDLTQSVAWDMTKQGEKPRLQKERDGTVLVHAYTDLKRHDLCDDPGDPDPIRYYCNEQLSQDRPAQDGRPASEFFLTRKLWDAGSSAPYGHRGDITTLTEAILYHAGEARDSRDNFAALPRDYQQEIVAFLGSLQVVSKKGND